MKKPLLIFLLIVLVNSSFSQSKVTIDKFFKWQYDSITKKPFILDLEKLFDTSQTKILNTLISNFEKESTLEICIVTFDTNFKTEDELQENTLYLAKYSKIGKKNKNNGILIGLSKKSRKIRIENGIGIKKILTDAETKKIIDDFFIPNFKNENYYLGTSNGLNKLIEVLSKRLNNNNQ